jgi:hypothetical protein
MTLKEFENLREGDYVRIAIGSIGFGKVSYINRDCERFTVIVKNRMYIANLDVAEIVPKRLAYMV